MCGAGIRNGYNCAKMSGTDNFCPQEPPGFPQPPPRAGSDFLAGAGLNWRYLHSHVWHSMTAIGWTQTSELCVWTGLPSIMATSDFSPGSSGLQRQMPQENRAEALSSTRSWPGCPMSPPYLWSQACPSSKGRKRLLTSQWEEC